MFFNLSAVTTVLNAAPGLKGLSREFFESTDILCLNETEVQCNAYISVNI